MNKLHGLRPFRLSKLSTRIRLWFALPTNIYLRHLDRRRKSHVPCQYNALHDAIAHYEVQNVIGYRVWKFLVLGPGLGNS